MKALFALALMATPALADPELLAMYGGGLEACVGAAASGAEMRACQGLLATTCVEQELNGMYGPVTVICYETEADFWHDVHAATYLYALTALGDADALDRADMPNFAVRREALEQAEVAWQGFREAHCAVADALLPAGPNVNVLRAQCIVAMTADHSADLVILVEGLE